MPCRKDVLVSAAVSAAVDGRQQDLNECKVLSMPQAMFRLVRTWIRFPSPLTVVREMVQSCDAKCDTHVALSNHHPDSTIFLSPVENG